MKTLNRLIKKPRSWGLLGILLVGLYLSGQLAQQVDQAAKAGPAAIAGAAGVALTLLLAFGAWVLLRRRDRVRAATCPLTSALGGSPPAARLRDEGAPLLRLLFNMPASVAYWDRDDRCRFASREFLRQYGTTLEAVIDQAESRISGASPDAGRAERLAQVFDGRALAFDRTDAGTAGAPRRRRVHFIPDREGDEVRGFLEVALDTTELHNAREDALRTSRAKSEFVANMSHELRTPMNAVLGMLQLVEKTPLTPQQRAYLGHAEGAARALLRVLDDVLDYANVEAGRMTLNPRVFEVDGLLRDLSLIHATSLAGKPVEFLYDIDPDLPPRFVADDVRLRQVLINLGCNAIKFTPHGQIVLAVRPVAWSPGAVTIEFSVQDTGVGIAPENLPLLLQAAGQAQGAAGQLPEGSGIGLQISRKLLALMGAELKVESSAGGGSRFSFQLTLPLLDEASLPSMPATSRPSRRALVVDAQEVTRQAHAGMLRNLGWTVCCAVSGEEAECLLGQAEPPFDAVLVDWMVDEAPLAVARRLGQRSPADGAVLVVHGPVEASELLARFAPGGEEARWRGLMRPFTPGMLERACLADRRPHDSPASPDRATFPLRGLRLLVAEDNENNKLIVRELLAAEGADVTIAADGIEAVARMREDGRFDAVLMDCRMPRMDGLQACREIRALGFRRLPIIAMTADAMESERRHCLAAGMDVHVAKPFDLCELVDVILEQTGRSQAADAGSPACDAAPSAVAPVPQSNVAQPPLLDRAAALDRLGGSVELYEQLVPMFREDLARTLETIDAAVTGAGDREQAKRQLHTLKGTAGTLGAMRLAAAARQAEAALARGEETAGFLRDLHSVSGDTLAALEAGTPEVSAVS